MPHKDPEARREYERKWRLKNGSRIKETKKRFYQRNRDQQIERTRIWQDENQDKYEKNLKKKNANSRFKRRGITKEEYEEMLLGQKGNCKLCGIPIDPKAVQIDHCHKTDIVRGLLCRPCNVGLGMFKDDRKMLERAILYLEGKL